MDSDRGRREARVGPARPLRGHELGDHTADARIHAWATTLPELYEEVALALSRLSSQVEPGSPESWSHVELQARDPEGLAFAWLNELIGMAELERRAITSTHVAVTERLADDGRGRWRLRARVGLADYTPGGTQALRHVKAATMHGLHIREQVHGWSMDVVVDI